MNENNIGVIVTGLSWMGGGVGSIESAMEQLFRTAEFEILLTAYSISNRADLLFDWLEIALGRGVETKLVINGFDKQPADVAARLYNLFQNNRHFYLYDFVGEDKSDLHAKSIVVDRRKAIVGSSNLSRRGLLTNYELALVIEGPAASNIASVIDRLLGSKQVVQKGIE